ncbi:MAG: mechanosensitive ion channel family protein [Mucinivorans sp.]
MKKILLTIFCSLCCLSVGAQNDTIPAIDSVEFADRALEMIMEQQMAKANDSIQQKGLRLQIANTQNKVDKARLKSELDNMRIADSLKLSQLKFEINRARAIALGYPVTLGEDTICILYTSNGSFTAADRARNSSLKIKEMADVFIPAIDSLVLIRNESALEIALGQKVFITITPSDALWQERPIDSLATKYLSRIYPAITSYQEARSWTTILKQLGLSLLVVILTYILIRLILWFFNKHISPRIVAAQGVWLRGWNFRQYELLDAARQVQMVLTLTKVLKWLLMLIALYISLPILFSIFPFTQRFAATLFDWVLDPVKRISLSVVEYIPDLLTVVVIVVVMRYVVRSIKILSQEIASGKLVITGFYPDWALATYNIVRFILYAFTFVMIFPYLPGSDSDIFKGVSVFLGVLFSLGSSSVVANIMAGLVITYMRPFLKGDHIKIGDTTGDVLEKTPFVTRIRTRKNEIVTIPNAQVLSTTVINYTTTAKEDIGVIFNVDITIGYDVPWRKVHQMMIQAASRVDLILTTPAPYVLQTALDDSYVAYQLCAYTKNPSQQFTIYSLLNQNIQDIFAENGVEIMSPLYRAMRNGNESTVPPKVQEEKNVSENQPSA